MLHFVNPNALRADRTLLFETGLEYYMNCGIEIVLIDEEDTRIVELLRSSDMKWLYVNIEQVI